MLKIAVVHFTNSEAFQCFFSGLQLSLSEILPKDSYKIIEYHGPSIIEPLGRHIQTCIANEDVNIFVCFGGKATQITYEATSRRLHKIPIIFSATTGPKELCPPTRGRENNHFTGVTMEVPKDLLPVQLLLRMKPDLKKLLIIYGAQGQAGRVSYEAKSIQKHLQEREVEVITHPIFADNLNTTALTIDLHNADAATILERSIFSYDIVKEITKIANKTNTLFWADGQEAIKAGAVFGTKADFEYMGYESGKQVVDITVHNKDVRKIPVKIVENSRCLHINKENAIAGGLALIDDLEISIDKAFNKYQELPMRSTSFVLPRYSCFEKEVMTGLTTRMQVDDDALFHFEVIEAWLTGSELETEAQLHQLLGKEYTQAVVVFGDEEGKKTIDHMIKYQVSKSVIVITDPKQHSANDDWHLKAVADGIKAVRVVVPPPSLVEQAAVLLKHAPRVSSVSLLAGMSDTKPTPEHIKQEVRELEIFCKEHGKQLHIVSSDDIRVLQNLPADAIHKNSGWLVHAESIPPAIMRRFALQCEKQNAIAVSPSLVWARFFPFSLGIDANRVGKQVLMPLLKRMIFHDRPPEYHTITLERADWYLTNINKELVKKMGIKLDAATNIVHTYSTVEVDYALDTAICMGQLDIQEKLEVLRQKEARKKKLLQHKSKAGEQKCLPSKNECA